MIRNNTKFKIIINSLISMNNKNIFEKLILFKFFTILAFLILFFIFVSRGGSSVVILNAIKDIKGSLLISLDLNERLFINKTQKTGHIVKEYFPELTKNWKLFVGINLINF